GKAAEVAAADLPHAVRHEGEQSQADPVQRRSAHQRSHPGAEGYPRLEEQECSQNDFANEEGWNSEVGEGSPQGQITGQQKSGDPRPKNHGDLVTTSREEARDRAQSYRELVRQTIRPRCGRSGLRTYEHDQIAIPDSSDKRCSCAAPGGSSFR